MWEGLGTAAAKGAVKKASGTTVGRLMNKAKPVQIDNSDVKSILSMNYTFEVSEVDKIDSDISKILSEDFNYSRKDGYEYRVLRYGDYRFMLSRQFEYIDELTWEGLSDFGMVESESQVPPTDRLTLTLVPRSNQIGSLEQGFEFFREFRSSLKSEYPERGSTVWLRLRSENKQALEKIESDLSRIEGLEMAEVYEGSQHIWLRVPITSKECLMSAKEEIEKRTSMFKRIAYYFPNITS